ncbi:hypothetical protein [Jannaschia sp. W003]|uniref:hypothetical protein n=1 Tax=Jannaschia sp. W003 TaxID=2867012 RepID=UPI0021A83E33|nr:hypothetical protein [Jannaschia sp. W003]UWQ20100.1 hypothetical protein K3554_08770 [Jannaschia sp. W003]
MTTISKLAGAAVLALALTPAAHAQDTPATGEAKEGGHMDGGMAGMGSMAGMEGMEGMEGMMPMMMNHMKACMEMMNSMEAHMQEHREQADEG